MIITAIVLNVLFIFGFCFAAKRGDAAMENYFACKKRVQPDGSVSNSLMARYQALKGAR